MRELYKLELVMEIRREQLDVSRAFLDGSKRPHLSDDKSMADLPAVEELINYSFFLKSEHLVARQ